jgi:hypothetical protein
MSPSILLANGLPAVLPLLAVMNLWYALPLLVSVSLVCAATRHEEIGPILQHAMRFGLWIVAFMAVVMGVLTLVGTLG